MNNNDSSTASMTDELYSAITFVKDEGTWKKTDAAENNGKLTVKYIGVVEEGVIFYLPINSTFRTE